MKLADAVESAYASRTGGVAERIVDVGDPLGRHVFERLPAGSAGGRTRALLKIQDGCDNYCAYCVIPRARGHCRSLPPDEAAAAAARLREAGFCEIVVTGIELSSYGNDSGGRYSMPDAVRAVASSAPGVRLRLGSLWPGTVTRGLARQLAEIPELCPHFHLSLQSGCDATLRRMGRGYTASAAFDAADALREAFPGCGITADLITGFPGETGGEFDETLAFIEKCAFSRMHVFPFSERPGTAAAELPGQIEKSVRRERARAVRSLAGRMAREFALQNVGKTADVLFESEKDGVSSGYAGNYLRVYASGMNLHNMARRVTITRARGEAVFGQFSR
jgi:threonylcarbamoyladenosine tRNA methylthiotransferase MtaB